MVLVLGLSLQTLRNFSSGISPGWLLRTRRYKTIVTASSVSLVLVQQPVELGGPRVHEEMHWLRFRQDGTQEIYFRVPSKTTPTTVLVAVIKAHRNRKTNLNAKTNPNPDLQKTYKKKLKEKRKKIITRTPGFEPVSS